MRLPPSGLFVLTHAWSPGNGGYVPIRTLYVTESGVSGDRALITGVAGYRIQLYAIHSRFTVSQVPLTVKSSGGTVLVAETSGTNFFTRQVGILNAGWLPVGEGLVFNLPTLTDWQGQVRYALMPA